MRVGNVLTCALTSGYLDLKGGAYKGHEGGGEVHRHVVVHRHVHEDESLVAAEKTAPSQRNSDTTTKL